MPSRIVTSTSTYRYKRPPRKRKTVPLEGSAMWASAAPPRCHLRTGDGSPTI
jgi:hypothetical protein